MTQDRQAQITGVAIGRPLARPGFERPVAHLHLDRRTRTWRRHDEIAADAARHLTVDVTTADAVRA